MNLTYLEIDHQRSSYDLLLSASHEEFLGRILFSWLYHDHALEGVVLNMETIQRALSERPTRNYCDAQVKKSLCRVRSAALDMLVGNHKEPITADWIKEMHKSMCDTDDPVAGRYRKRDTTPGVYNLNCVQSSSISYHLRKFFEIYDGELRNMHPIRKAAIAHWEFMRVFPFDEKTGIVGRLMMNHILTQNGYPPAIIHAQDRHLYFSALDGNRTDLVPVISDAIRATLNAAEIFYEEFVESSNLQVAL